MGRAVIVKLKLAASITAVGKYLTRAAKALVISKLIAIFYTKHKKS